MRFIHLAGGEEIKNLPDDGDLFLGTGHEDHSICLEALLLSLDKQFLWGSIHCHQLPSEAISGHPALTVAKLNQAALPCKHFTDSSRLYSAAMVRFTALISVDIGLPSFLNCSAG